MKDLNYYRTLIAVADDCPVTSSVVPEPRGGKPTVAVLQYEMLVSSPGTLTQPDVLFESWLARQDKQDDLGEGERQRLRQEFFTGSRACLRASPLPKTHGGGLLFDDDGRIFLCAVESSEYRRLVDGDDVRVLRAMRSRRA